MSSSPSVSLAPLLARLNRHSVLTDADLEAFRRLPVRSATFGAGEQVIRHASKTVHCYIMLSGYAFCHKVAAGGAREILSFYARGDLIGLDQAMLGLADHGVRALSPIETAVVPAQAIIEAMSMQPNIGLAMVRQSLVDMETMREWLLNVARRPARSRLAHLLCELACRQDDAPPADGVMLDCRLTQEQMADALGLTAVHVNRVVQALRSAELIRIDNRQVTILDWAGLQAVGEFRTPYLHLRDPVAAPSFGSAQPVRITAVQEART